MPHVVSLRGLHRRHALRHRDNGDALLHEVIDDLVDHSRGLRIGQAAGVDLVKH